VRLDNRLARLGFAARIANAFTFAATSADVLGRTARREHLPARHSCGTGDHGQYHSQLRPGSAKRGRAQRAVAGRPGPCGAECDCEPDARWHRQPDRAPGTLTPGRRSTTGGATLWLFPGGPGGKYVITAAPPPETPDATFSVYDVTVEQDMGIVVALDGARFNRFNRNQSRMALAAFIDEVRKLTQDNKLAAIAPAHPDPGPGRGVRDEPYFIRGSLVDGIHVFRAPLALGAWTIAGPVRQLTSGGGIHLNLSMASNGRMLISILNAAQDFVSLPLPPAASGASGPLTKITSDATIKGGLSISRDGSVAACVAFVSWETGRIEIRVRTLATGRETVYRSETLPGSADPQISPDGWMLAYAEEIAGKPASYIGQPESLRGRQICEDCQILGFSADSRQALIRYGVNHLVRQDPFTGARAPLLTVDAGEVPDARLSPDDRWVVVVVAAPERLTEAYVVPVGESPALPGTWLRVPIGRSFVGSWVQRGGRRTVRPPSPVWSADGGELYYFSDRDGHTCVWAQRLDARTKQPRGAPYPL